MLTFDDLSDLEIDLLSYIAAYGLRDDYEISAHMFSIANTNHATVMRGLASLDRKDLVFKGYMSGAEGQVGPQWQLTAKGQDFVIDEGLV